VREGARAVLDARPPIEVLGTAGDPDELLALLASTRSRTWSCSTSGCRRPSPPRASSSPARPRDHPGIGIVVLSQHDDPEYALELLKDGSDGVAYLLKERLGDADRLVQAIDEVRDRRLDARPRIVEALLEAQRRRTASKLAGLTPRSSRCSR
jgi:DNA-binding NarL/FixJ family response regulator